MGLQSFLLIKVARFGGMHQISLLVCDLHTRPQSCEQAACLVCGVSDHSKDRPSRHVAAGVAKDKATLLTASDAHSDAQN